MRDYTTGTIELGAVVLLIMPGPRIWKAGIWKTGIWREPAPTTSGGFFSIPVAERLTPYTSTQHIHGTLTREISAEQYISGVVYRNIENSLPITGTPTQEYAWVQQIDAITSRHAEFNQAISGIIFREIPQTPLFSMSEILALDDDDLLLLALAHEAAI